MQYTKEQESEFLTKWTPFVHKMVRMFMANARSEVSEEDLFQEGMIAMLLQLRVCADEEELRKTSANAVRNALARYIMRQSLLHRPVRTSAYKKTVVAARNERVSLDSGTALYKSEMCEDGWIARMDLDDFLSRLPQRQREFLRLRRDGYSNNSIAQAYGVTPSCVTQTVRRSLKRFKSEQKGA